MAHALLAWELGGNLGHLAPLRALARQLRAQGHRVSFALRDLSGAEAMLEPGLGAVFQAPVMRPPQQVPAPRQPSYAGLLQACGYDDPAGLAAHLRAWRTLMIQLACDRLYADHAPTALLAARGLDLPRVHFGTGFSVPPCTQPFPPFDADAPPGPGTLEALETRLLGVINGAQGRLGLAPLHRVQDLFEGARALVTSYPELDHYAAVPRAERYIGLPDFSFGARPLWPSPRAPRLFAYLRPSTQLAPLLAALQRSSAHALVRIAGMSASRLAQSTRPNLLIVDRDVHMRQAAQSCDAFINYAAHGTVAEMLLAGRPGLLLPDTLERGLVARRAQQLGAALVQLGGESADYDQLLQQLIENTDLHRRAKLFADHHGMLDRHGILPRIAMAADLPHA